jgi:hypothetical protein
MSSMEGEAIHWDKVSKLNSAMSSTEPVGVDDAIQERSGRGVLFLFLSLILSPPAGSQW